MLQKGAIEEVFNQSSPGFYSGLFTVPKPSGGFRPILNLSPLNKFLKTVRFKMESAESIRKEVRPGDWACSLDLKDAYFHISMRKADRKWLRFTWRGKVYQHRVLPFGLSLSPWAFTKLVKDLLAVCRKRKMRFHAYLDDWLILAKSEYLCRQHVTFIKKTAEKLGFRINKEKSELSPSQEFTFLGMKFNTRNQTVSPSEQRVQSLQDLLRTLLTKRTTSARTLARVLGKMESLAPLLTLGRLHKRPLQRKVASVFNQTTDSWNTKIVIQPWFLHLTRQWRDRTWLKTPVPTILPDPVATIFTDASEKGWGAHMGDITAEGQWTQSLPSFHINRLELEAVFQALSTMQHSIPKGPLLIRSDNSTVVALINKQGGTHAPALSQRAEEILLWAQDKKWSLAASHIAGSANIMADLLSRPDKIIQTEWTLTHNALEQIWTKWEKPLLDLFATKFSKRLPVYVSPVQDPQALQVDAMDMSWENLTAYAFPPWSILQKVLEKAKKEQPNLILIAPFWPTKSWFPKLLSLSHEAPLRLNISNKDLVQPRSGIQHGNVTTLSLHAWALCGNTCKGEECQKEP